MTAMSPTSLLNFWYEALSSPYGIEIVCTDADSARARLYQVRRDAKDTDLEKVSATISPFDPTRLWLIKKDQPDATP